MVLSADSERICAGFQADFTNMCRISWCCQQHEQETSQGPRSARSSSCLRVWVRLSGALLVPTSLFHAKPTVQTEERDSVQGPSHAS